APVAIGSDGVGSVELSSSGSARSPCHQVLSVLVELHNARVAVTVADEERAVRQPGHVGRPFEMLIVSTGFIAFPERHQQLLSIVCEFEYMVKNVVADPYTVLWVVGLD